MEAWPDASHNFGIVQKKRCTGQIAVDCKSLSPHSPVVRLTHDHNANLAVNCKDETSTSFGSHRENCSRLQSEKSSSVCNQLQMGPDRVAECCGKIGSGLRFRRSIRRYVAAGRFGDLEGP